MAFKTMVQSHLDLFYDTTRLADLVTFRDASGNTDQVAVIVDPDEYTIIDEIIEGERIIRVRTDPAKSGVLDPVGGEFEIFGRFHSVKSAKQLAGGDEWELLLSIGSKV